MKLQIAILLFVIGFLSACSNQNKSGNILLTSSGNTSEMLLVTHKVWWDGAIGDTIKSTLGETSVWLVQEEPLFDIKRISPKNFDDIYQKQRNILIITKDEKLSEPKIDIRKDVWAQPQVVVKISIPNELAFSEFYTKYYQQIILLFTQNELLRLNNSFSKNSSKVASSQLSEKFGINLSFPKGYTKVMDTTDFIWFRFESQEMEFGIMVYTYSYSDTSQFSEKKIIQIRNEMTKKYIPGPDNESKMQISKVFPPYSERVKFKGQYATMLRSWWELDNYPMGGPFLSYTFYDEKNQRMMVLDSYVSAPNKPKKRDILIQLEAVFDTFSFSDTVSVVKK